MFFIVPSSAKAASAPPRKPSKMPKLSSTHDLETTAYYRRRVPTACDRCRLKKARCSGGQAPCKKCERDGVLCVISKDRTVDLKPKAPGYIKMVESQRDVLLRAVHELRQRSKSDSDTSLDMNKVLQELNIHLDDPDNISHSILQEMALPQTAPSRDATDLGTNLELASLDFTALDNFPWLDTTSTSTTLPSSPKIDASNSVSEKVSGTKRPTQTKEEQVPEAQPDTYDFEENMLCVQRASAGTDTYFDYNMTSAVLPDIADMERLQQQIWQDVDMEFLDMNAVQGAL